MRGYDRPQTTMLTLVNPEKRVPVPAQNSISCEVRGLRRVRCDEMHELSRTPTIPDRARRSVQSVVAMWILHAMAWLAAQGPASEIAQPSKADQAARRS